MKAERSRSPDRPPDVAATRSGIAEARTLPLTKSGRIGADQIGAAAVDGAGASQDRRMPATREETRPTVRRAAPANRRGWRRSPPVARRGSSRRDLREGWSRARSPVRTSRLALRTFTRPNSKRSSTSGRHCPPDAAPRPLVEREPQLGVVDLQPHQRTFCSSGRTVTCANTREILRSILPPGSPTRSPSMVRFPAPAPPSSGRPAPSRRWPPRSSHGVGAEVVGDEIGAQERHGCGGDDRGGESRRRGCGSAPGQLGFASPASTDRSPRGRSACLVPPRGGWNGDRPLRPSAWPLATAPPRARSWATRSIICSSIIGTLAT